MQNVSNFNDVNDYLYILNGVIITDLVIIALCLGGAIPSKVLRQWYKDYTLSAVIADVLIIVIGIIIARFLYSIIFSKYSLFKFLLLVVLIQITHDLLFYYFVTSVPRGWSRILDTFKNYGKESGFKAILSDSLMMISSVLIACYLKSLSLNTNIIILISVIYLIPYLIFSV